MSSQLTYSVSQSLLAVSKKRDIIEAMFNILYVFFSLSNTGALVLLGNIYTLDYKFGAERVIMDKLWESQREYDPDQSHSFLNL